MKLFQHRVNDLSALDSLGKNVAGFECDIRYSQGDYFLSHDPILNFDHSLSFKYFLDDPRCSGLDIILNFKETGGELRLLNMCKSIFKEILILDAPFPVYVQALKQGLSSHFMWRISEYESVDIEILRRFSAKWLWLDSFDSYWFDKDLLNKRSNLKCMLCHVLQCKRPTCE